MTDPAGCSQGQCQWHKVMESEVENIKVSGKKNCKELMVLRQQMVDGYKEIRKEVMDEVPTCKKDVEATFNNRLVAIWTLIVVLFSTIGGVAVWASGKIDLQHEQLSQYKIDSQQIHTRNTTKVDTLEIITANSGDVDATIIELLGDIKSDVKIMKSAIKMMHPELEIGNGSD